MRLAEVEIYADATNAAIVRLPYRRFPGCLIQGDSLHAALQSLMAVARERSALSEDAADGLDDVIQSLAEILGHYKSTLEAEQIDLPFVEGRG